MMRRGIGRRGPGLAGTVARTAVVAGTATAVSGNVARRQAGKAQEEAIARQQAAAAQQAAAPPPPPPAAEPAPAGGLTPEAIAQLKELANLRDQGILTEEEFAAQKALLLGT
ncbi:MAG: SHOCT domain-containing protein [Acidimicrobiales bacterium]|jgi:hypothetical protein|nr:SHOCT domain-containing protein [Acidimicrobiales bacterium]